MGVVDDGFVVNNGLSPWMTCGRRGTLKVRDVGVGEREDEWRIGRGT